MRELKEREMIFPRIEKCLNVRELNFRIKNV